MSEHTRTYTWNDEKISPRDERVASLSGLEYMRALLRGDLPGAPIAATLDFRPVELEEGRVVFEGEPQGFVYNPIGTVHGGYAATLLDSALGCAIHTTLRAGQGYTTLELKVNYVRAMTDGTGPVRAEGNVIHVGGSVATAEGRIVGVRDGKLYAHATTTCMIFGGRR